MSSPPPSPPFIPTLDQQTCTRQDKSMLKLNILTFSSSHVLSSLLSSPLLSSHPHPFSPFLSYPHPFSPIPIPSLLSSPIPIPSLLSSPIPIPSLLSSSSSPFCYWSQHTQPTDTHQTRQINATPQVSKLWRVGFI